MSEITYACVTQDRAPWMRRNLQKILPFVDRAVIVDGGSKDDTVVVCQGFGPKVKVVHFPWCDDFSASYNAYLREITGGWVLICDDDELPSYDLLRVLRPLADGGGNQGVAFQSANIYEFSDDDIEFNVPGNGHHRNLYYPWNRSCHYTVRLHQNLNGVGGGFRHSSEVYYHIKRPINEWYNSGRNYWTSGIWDDGGGSRSISEGIMDSDYWNLIGLAKRHHPEVRVWRDLDTLLKTKRVHPDILRWAVWMYKKYENSPIHNEARAVYKLYYEFYHKGEVPIDVNPSASLLDQLKYESVW